MKANDQVNIVESRDRLTVGPRHQVPCSDDLVLAVRHRTIGDPRSILLSRAVAADLHAWLGRWLDQGWDGVPRQCGEMYTDRDDPGSCARWQCTLDPDDGHKVHDGKPTVWRIGSVARRQQWVSSG